jgi:hypothetical protein
MAVVKYFYKILVAKHEGRRKPRILGHKGEVNITIYLR